MTNVCSRALLATVLTTTLAGCTVFPAREVPRQFALAEPEVTAKERIARSVILRVDTPVAASPLDTSRIVVRQDSGELAIYGGSRWRQPATDLVRDQLIEALRQSQGFTGVVNEISRSRSDWSLLTDLGQFQVVYENGSPVATVRLDAQLMDERSRSLLSTRRFEARQASTDESLEAVVAAFSRATNQMAKDVVAWILEQPAP
ncbi:ABC-type transport auxiliary lipoprotein family protein [uncultured Marinobacter sp.]|uniref:ABC-type transport auxiliary lipoprotein family protein n=1 Tax=uncultured Marinobacter sp. TaxID=187379 RepID=UPI0030D84804